MMLGQGVRIRNDNAAFTCAQPSLECLPGCRAALDRSFPTSRMAAQ